MSENASTITPEPSSGGTSKKSLMPLVIFLLLVVVILLGGVGFLLLSGGNSLISLPGSLGGSSGVDQDDFVLNMNKLVLSPKDMTAKYNIVPGGNMHMSNSQLSNDLGAALGKPLIVSTKRVDGWDLAMERVNPDDFTPEYIRNRV